PRNAQESILRQNLLQLLESYVRGRTHSTIDGWGANGWLEGPYASARVDRGAGGNRCRCVAWGGDDLRGPRLPGGLPTRGGRRCRPRCISYTIGMTRCHGVQVSAVRDPESSAAPTKVQAPSGAMQDSTLESRYAATVIGSGWFAAVSGGTMEPINNT